MKSIMAPLNGKCSTGNSVGKSIIRKLGAFVSILKRISSLSRMVQAEGEGKSKGKGEAKGKSEGGGKAKGNKPNWDDIGHIYKFDPNGKYMEIENCNCNMSKDNENYKKS